MSDIFISYKREEQPVALRLADALGRLGWDVWWDPKLRAGEHFDDVIEEALKAARCVVVLWSQRSVRSRYVKSEAAYALDLDKLIPVAIEAVDLPLRFRGIHTAQLIDWDGSNEAEAFHKLTEDIKDVIGPPPTVPHQPTPRGVAEIPRPAVKSPASSGPEPGTVSRDTLKDGSEGPEMVVIPAGSFQMGSPAGGGDDYERPQHRVSIAKPFAMGKYPVTFDEYDCFSKATDREQPNDRGWGRGRRPVIYVSWKDAVAYAEWLSEQTGKRYRLPTEAEWEYAARAGTETAYWWGNHVGKNKANCNGCGGQWDGRQTAPVGSFEPNAWGLHDTAGNVWEWVQDCWHESYEGAPGDGSAWETGDCALRVLRGGYWFVKPRNVRSANRGRFGPGNRFTGWGFRLAQDL